MGKFGNKVMKKLKGPKSKKKKKTFKNSNDKMEALINKAIKKKISEEDYKKMRLEQRRYMKWLMVLAVTILHNENSFPPKTYELRAFTSFGHCSQAKADIDYIFKDKHETVVVVAECYTEEGYKSYLEDMQKNKDKGRKLLEIK